ncbi:hypothetical protein BV22DRAFT_1044974 [Leucogyrophana mollusca]|uniref:Uncharacterized protein n=1 Tax=Leucogyrophana mollusca TaxID=85980 RepID=A0ACB8BRH1_9AGAM|nr:hypothetical protein BV22DRAFT_1044974 [Leucogyrophana mollusca]
MHQLILSIISLKFFAENLWKLWRKLVVGAARVTYHYQSLHSSSVRHQGPVNISLTWEGRVQLCGARQAFAGLLAQATLTAHGRDVTIRRSRIDLALWPPFRHHRRENELIGTLDVKPAVALFHRLSESLTPRFNNFERDADGSGQSRENLDTKLYALSSSTDEHAAILKLVSPPRYRILAVHGAKLYFRVMWSLSIGQSIVFAEDRTKTGHKATWPVVNALSITTSGRLDALLVDPKFLGNADHENIYHHPRCKRHSMLLLAEANTIGNPLTSGTFDGKSVRAKLLEKPTDVWPSKEATVPARKN